MKADEAIAHTERLLLKVGKWDWTVQVVPFTDYPDRFGAASSQRKCIDLNPVYLADEAEMRETIAHEVAHAMTVGDNEHGLPFQAALAYCRKKL
jgi:predicted SprT family Zn-dependent metalloprotease